MFSKRDHANPMAETVRAFRKAVPGVDPAEGAGWRPVDAFRAGPGADAPAPAHAAPAEPVHEAHGSAPDEMAQARAARDLLNRLVEERKITLRCVDADGNSRAIDGDLVLCRLVPRVEYDEVPLA